MNTMEKAGLLLMAHRQYKAGMLSPKVYDLMVKGLTLDANSLRMYINYAYL